MSSEGSKAVADMKSHKGMKVKSYTMGFKLQAIKKAEETSNRNAAQFFKLIRSEFVNGDKKKRLLQSKKRKSTEKIARHWTVVGGNHLPQKWKKRCFSGSLTDDQTSFGCQE